jgi:glutathione S-transferase
MGPPLALYLAPGSSSMAPHIALNEVGAAFEVRPVSFARGGTGSPEFLAINPEGKVPVLLADGARLTEVAAILYYLARRFPEAGLMPWGDPLAEAEAVSWMSFIASAVHPARRQGLEASLAVWRLAELRLGDRDWALGRYSIADIHLFRLYWRFLVSLKPPAGAFPRLQEHHDRMMRRPAVNRTLEAEAAIGYELPS